MQGNVAGPGRCPHSAQTPQTSNPLGISFFVEHRRRLWASNCRCLVDQAQYELLRNALSIYAPDRYTIRLTLKVSWRGSAGHLGSAFVLPPFCTHVQFAGLLFLTAMYQYNECLRANFTTRHCICASPHLYMMRDTDTANIDSLTKAR
jgi:hypothetical protein